jgi:hypothetical protein
LAIEKSIVASSVETCYNGKKIGRAAYGHKILTRSGCKEIEFIFLLPDLRQREVLCRRYGKNLAPTKGTSGDGGKRERICPEQRMEKIRGSGINNLGETESLMVPGAPGDPWGEGQITVLESENVEGACITGEVRNEPVEIISLSIGGDCSYVAGGIIVHNSTTCVAYSGAEWDLAGNPIGGTTLPFNGGTPRHWGCRSILTPITKTFAEMGIKGLPELADTGERASDLGPIDRKTTMDQFLKMHDTDWQDKMLGKGKAQLWREGKITLSQLVSGSGRELTLKELKAL